MSDGGEVHLIRPISDAKSPRICIPEDECGNTGIRMEMDLMLTIICGGKQRHLHLCQWDVSGHTCTSVYLYSTVHHLTGHPGCGHLDHSNLENTSVP